VKEGGDGPQKLHLIGRLGGVNATCREVPSNVIIHHRNKVHILAKDPKIDELREVVHGEVVTQFDVANPSICI
jgi:hypothetical protein